jgi:hypothetical protein
MKSTDCSRSLQNHPFCLTCRMKHFAALVLLFILFEACRKDEDTEAPTVVITSPVAGSSFDVLDVFTVSISVSDNEALSRVDVRLVTDNLIQALPVSSHNATGTSQNLNVVYALDDVRMSSGSYFIEAVAYDAAGNEEHAYVQLNITAVPLRLLGVAAVYTSLNSVTVSEADTLWSVNVLGNYPGDFADLGVSSWWQQVAYTGKLSGPFRCWSLDGNYQGWTANAFPSSGDYWGRCESYEREWFVNYRADGVIRAKSWNGQNTLLIQVTFSMRLPAPAITFMRIRLTPPEPIACYPFSTKLPAEVPCSKRI